MDAAVISVIAVAGGLIITITGSLLYLGWWLAHQFSLIRSLIYSESKETQLSILNKLEYHERHDDARFASVQHDLWEIRVRDAAREGLSSVKE